MAAAGLLLGILLTAPSASENVGGSPVGQAGGDPISAAFKAREEAEAAEKAEAAEEAEEADERAPGPLKAILELLLLGYRNGVSPVDGPSCPFHPTCSRFARQAIAAHGAALGILMTGDRLMRCNGSGLEEYPRLHGAGKPHDPPPP